jgi:hypothetical protein
MNEIRLVLVIMITTAVAACSPGKPACHPVTAAAIDEACVTAIVETVERECPDSDILDCPRALGVMLACEEIIDAHAEGCAQ